MDVDREIVEVVKKLKEEQKKLLVDFARLLESRQDMKKISPSSSSEIWNSVSSWFAADSVREMEEAVKDCEEIDENGWQ